MKLNQFFQIIGVATIAIASTLILQSALSPKAMQSENIPVYEAVPVEGMLGEIRLFAGNFAPRGWAFCEGQLLPISNYTAVFSILGTTYGGDGRTTFALPDLRGRVPMHPGTGPGLGTYALGQKIGNESFTSSPSSNVMVDRYGKNYVLQSPQTDLHQPSLGLNYIICLSGIFPSRN